MLHHHRSSSRRLEQCKLFAWHIQVASVTCFRMDLMLGQLKAPSQQVSGLWGSPLLLQGVPHHRIAIQFGHASA